VTPVPRRDPPVTPLLKIPDVLKSFPKTPSLPLVAEVLFTLVMPFEPLPVRETPLIPGPVPLLSYSIHGRELVQVGSITPPAFAGCDLCAPMMRTEIRQTGIANIRKRNRFIVMLCSSWESPTDQ